MKGAACPGNDTLCRFNVGQAVFCLAPSGGVNGGGVDQQNGDAVLDGIDAAAFSALQAGRILFQHERFLASRTNQDIEQILRNHDGLF